MSSQVDTVYDGMDRKVRETVSSGGTAYMLTQYSYDDGSLTWLDNNYVTHTSDGLDRLTSI